MLCTLHFSLPVFHSAIHFTPLSAIYHTTDPNFRRPYLAPP